MTNCYKFSSCWHVHAPLQFPRQPWDSDSFYFVNCFLESCFLDHSVTWSYHHTLPPSTIFHVLCLFFNQGNVIYESYALLVKSVSEVSSTHQCVSYRKCLFPLTPSQHSSLHWSKFVSTFVSVPGFSPASVSTYRWHHKTILTGDIANGFVSVDARRRKFHWCELSSLSCLLVRHRITAPDILWWKLSLLSTLRSSYHWL